MHWGATPPLNLLGVGSALFAVWVKWEAQRADTIATMTFLGQYFKPPLFKNLENSSVWRWIRSARRHIGCRTYLISSRQWQAVQETTFWLCCTIIPLG
jgi:hypothetical protein